MPGESPGEAAAQHQGPPPPANPPTPPDLLLGAAAELNLGPVPPDACATMQTAILLAQARGAAGGGMGWVLFGRPMHIHGACSWLPIGCKPQRSKKG
jgi:hypothetical protein